VLARIVLGDDYLTWTFRIVALAWAIARLVCHWMKT
jgi:hypothetical protein